MWCIGSAHAFNVGEPGFDPTPKPRRAFYRKLSSPFFQKTDLKTIKLCGVILKQKKIKFFFRSLQVSWFRRQNSSLSVLTIGKETFSADLRYSMELDKSANNWRLRIRPTMAIDDGTYLCQISTHPPTILVTNLKIIGKISFI
jgi:hypothetical protein